MGLDPKGVDIQIWKPEAGTSYQLASTTPATGSAGGADVVFLKGNIPAPIPVASYETAALQAQGLPMELTPAQSAATLAAAGVEPIEAVGEVFDPQFHEAIETVETTPENEGRVIAEHTRGYKIGDRLLRPARVKVGRSSAKANQAAE
jgi:hypothetical protein